MSAGEAWYSYLVNEWIPYQQDAEYVMRLFMNQAAFNPVAFVRILKMKSARDVSPI